MKKAAKKKPPRKSRAAPASRAAAPVVVAPAAQPRQAELSPFSPYGWLITVRAKAMASPRYTGSSSEAFIAFPTLSFRRPGDPEEWSSPDDSINFAAFTRSGFNIGPSIGLRGGRYDKGNSELRGIHNVGWTLEPGAFASLWVVPDTLRARAEVRRGFRQEDGFNVSLGVDWVTRWRDLTLAIGPRVNFADARFMRLRFGVTAADSLRHPALAPHAPGAGLYSAGAYGSITWKASDAWSFTAHVGRDRLTGPASASPIVRQTGNRNQFTGGVTASYTFQLTR